MPALLTGALVDDTIYLRGHTYLYAIAASGLYRGAGESTSDE